MSGPPLDAGDRWARLRATTPARIGLARTGDALVLRPVLDLQAAHAAARDAVHAALDVAALAASLAPRPVLRARSLAPDRGTYLKRPDLGRALDPDDAARLARAAGEACDCAFILADGLSALAVGRHAAAVFALCCARLAALRLAPPVIATQARVALGDPIGAALRARVCVVLIGERPGLSCADSLGAYVTFAPAPGRRDAERNCVSNIHAGGLSSDAAAAAIAGLVEAALARGQTGVVIKPQAPLLPR